MNKRMTNNTFWLSLERWEKNTNFDKIMKNYPTKINPLHSFMTKSYNRCTYSVSVASTLLESTDDHKHIKSVRRDINNLDKSNMYDMHNMYDMSDMQIIYHDNKLSSNVSNPKISHNCFYITFDTNKIIKEISQSYQKDGGNRFRNITKANNIDFPRMTVHYNRKQLTDQLNFYSMIMKFRAYWHHIVDTYYELLIMLVTQAPFFYSYKIIHEFYNDSENNLSIVQHTDSPTIDIIDDIDENKTIKIMFKKTYKLVDTNTKKTIQMYHTCMMISFNIIDRAKHDTTLYWLNELI